MGLRLRTAVRLTVLVVLCIGVVACRSAQDTIEQSRDQAARALREFGARVIVRDELVQRQVEMLGATSIILRSVKPPQDSLDDDDARVVRYGLQTSDYARITRTIPVVSRAVPVREMPAEARRDEYVSQIRLIGCTPDAFHMNRLTMEQGRALSDADLRPGGNVAVLSHAVSEELFAGRDAVGQIIEIAGVSLAVVGKRARRDDTDIAVLHSVGRADDSRDVYIPLATMRARIGSQLATGQDDDGKQEFVELSQITVVVGNVSQVDQAAKTIDALLKKYHKQPDYSILVSLDLARQASDLSKTEQNQVVGVNLSGVRITDATLKPLGLLPDLEMLILNGTDITDDGLGHLHSLMSLRTLFLRQTKVTDAGVANLQEALPECVVYR
ncbi:MAG: ABC transporter permease [Planctomycetes bacterium]|nr:ABC transporter permease [Planctomycetota bacterium]